MATQATTTILPVEYKGYTIQEREDTYYKGMCPFVLFPTEQGIQHDYDYNGSGNTYCGNCKWADSIEEAKEMIDEIIELSWYSNSK